LGPEIAELSARAENGQLSKDGAKQLRTARRVYDGAQITVYISIDPIENRSVKEAMAVAMKEVDQMLRERGIAPGDQPTSDEPVNEFISFRVDQIGRSYIEEDDERYEQHRATFKDRPAFLALQQAFAE
jgi:hypothetical protein